MADFPSQRTKNLFPNLKEELESAKAEAFAKKKELNKLLQYSSKAREQLAMCNFDLKDFKRSQNKILIMLDNIREMQFNRIKMVNVVEGLHNAQESQLKAKKEAVEAAASAITSTSQLLENERKKKDESANLLVNLKKAKDSLQQKLGFYERENAKMTEETKDLQQVLEEEETLKLKIAEQLEMSKVLTEKIGPLKQHYAEIDAAAAAKTNEMTAKIQRTHAETAQLQQTLNDQHKEQKQIFLNYFAEMEGLKELKQKSEDLGKEVLERERAYMKRKAELKEVNEKLNMSVENEEVELNVLEEKVKQMRERDDEVQKKIKDVDFEKVQENIKILQERNEELDMEIAERKIQKPEKNKDVNETVSQKTSDSSKVTNWLRSITSPDSLANNSVVSRRMERFSTSTTSHYSFEGNDQEDTCEVSSTYVRDIDLFD
ncbi:coiled-coil domain-containing protein 89-like [Phlebotomus papatasi]|uniref:coiled-coil domain-containing protein 89-like n=1 Tax=Phlebotomus papatasi TaxID=29031 RepID=UPI0024838C69|nr:coiled-coil domain-containing protein 89-like [Phlebotomus papatasi]